MTFSTTSVRLVKKETVCMMRISGGGGVLDGYSSMLRVTSFASIPQHFCCKSEITKRVYSR